MSTVDKDLDYAFSTPAVRHLAKKNGLNLNKIKATGKNGRVMKEDVLNYIESGQAAKDK